jgi:PAS domain S-box-containing protein
MKRPAANRKSANGPGEPGRASVADPLISPEDLRQLQDNLREANETLDAIRRGEVDAVIVAGQNGEQVYSLSSAEQPYRVYVERMQEGAVTVSAGGLILFCNRRFAEMLGRPLERAIGTPLPDCLPPEAWRRVADVFSRAGEVVKCESTLRRDGAASLPVNLTASLLSTDEPAMMCLVVTDLTVQKETTELRLAKEIAERASAAKDDFLAALSHELRTPLTPALMAATVLEKDASLPESARSDISLIRRNIELEARLIDDLLDLTLIAHGKLALQSEEVNVHTSLTRAIEICQGDARRKRQTLHIELNATRATIIGDPVRVQQACWNVLRNAVKFTPEGGRIAITTGNDTHGLWLRFQDSGIGILPDQAAKIFDAFEQGGRHITRQFGGLGLGLAITRSILEAQGGSIEAGSAGANLGATFTLRFPLAAASRPPSDTRPPVEHARRTTGLNILLVEDHKDTRACIQRLLEASGHRIISVGTAQAGLDLAASSRLDLVISDLGLPDMTGHELMRQLHTRHRLPGIALSGYGMENDIEASRQAGFTHHLTKPVSFERLKSFVAEFAAKRHKA